MTRIRNLLLVQSDFVARRTIGAIAAKLLALKVTEAPLPAAAQRLYDSEKFDALIVDLSEGPASWAWLEQLGVNAPPMLVLLPDAIDPDARRRLDAIGPTFELVNPVKITRVVDSLRQIMDSADCDVSRAE